MNDNIIYGLVDPLTREIRYIGQSRVGMRRPKSHFSPSSLKIRASSKNLDRKQAWISSLLSQGIKPDIIVLEELECLTELNEAEQFWIQYFKSLGANLTNGIFLSISHEQRIPWNKGLKNDDRLRGGVRKGNRPWNTGLKGVCVAWNKGHKGSIPWNKGLKGDPRCKGNTTKGKVPWNKKKD